MSNKNHNSGSDRIAEFAKDMNADIIVNVQGDEPLIDKNSLNLDGVYNKNEFSGSLVKNVIVNNFIGCAMAFTSSTKKSTKINKILNVLVFL